MAMPTGTLVSEEEYLQGSYEPEYEFEDGVLIERNVGAPKHDEVETAVSGYFLRRRKAWGIKVGGDARFRVRPGKYMLPDVYVMRPRQASGTAYTEPPLIWIEILSPEDRPVRVNRKIRELLAFGAPYIWVIDPETLESELHTPTGVQELKDRTLRISGTDIVVPLDDIFED